MTPATCRSFFFSRLAPLEEGTPGYQYARNTLVEMNMTLVRYAAGRFRHRSDEMEDIVQVGMIGLIKAIDRFDLSRETQFATFAVPYIVGQIKRFFRGTSWAVHVPRQLQEARVELVKATEELSSRLGRAPKVSELAALMNLTEDEVIEARMASNGYNSTSLDTAVHGDGEAALANFIGEEDPAMELVENFHALARSSPNSANATGAFSTFDSSRNSLSPRSASVSTSPIARISPPVPHPGPPQEGNARDPLTRSSRPGARGVQARPREPARKVEAASQRRS